MVACRRRLSIVRDMAPEILELKNAESTLTELQTNLQTLTSRVPAGEQEELNKINNQIDQVSTFVKNAIKGSN